MKDKTDNVAEGCMTFIRALINDHHADPLAVYERLTLLCSAETARIRNLDPLRNR